MMYYHLAPYKAINKLASYHWKLMLFRNGKDIIPILYLSFAHFLSNIVITCLPVIFDTEPSV